MLTRNLLLCSVLVASAACSAPSSPPSTGNGSGVSSDSTPGDPAAGEDGTELGVPGDPGAQSGDPGDPGAEPGSPADVGGPPGSTAPADPLASGTPVTAVPATPGGLVVNDDGTATVTTETGEVITVNVVLNDDGTTTLVTDEGEVIVVVEETVDDILMTGPSGAPGCGDGMLTEDEACDDGNTTSADGCAGDCLTLSSGYSCAVPGQPCQPIARCGDGLVAASEQCDDMNAVAGDGCSERCKVELGKKCDGEPSVCTDAQCGNGMREGAEACDDGNGSPFDGCSALCLREPDCSGTSCTSDCGDGLVINEACDDGNTTTGDGCSASCELEVGFTCTQVAVCELINDECVLRVPAIFRDFPASHPDFGFGAECGTETPVLGVAADDLDAEGRPVLGSAIAAACVSSAATFAQWFRGDGNVTLVGDLVLFDNGNGGYVNRFGANGEAFEATVPGAGGEMAGYGGNATECAATCTQRTRDSLQCENVCRPQNDAVDQTGREYDQAVSQGADAATLDALQAEIDDLTVVAASCETDCQTEFDTRAEACALDCKPCSFSNDGTQWCVGGEYVMYDGNPLFFPVDGVTGATADLGPAKVPEQYGYDGWPWEEDVFGTAVDHNFYFTTEVQYWFRYEADTTATLDFTGDDDVWVFVNGRLAVDLGGIHVPLDGSITVNAQSADRFGLEPGNVYEITVFQAERKMEGSSFKLTLSGFEATPSDCSAVCGDAVLSFGEECDDGANDGGYGECAEGCRLGEFCGDGIVNGQEDCDNGPGGGQGCPNCRMLSAR